MSLPALMAGLMGGGALPPLGDLIQIPCARCLANGVPEPLPAVTLHKGTATCAPHINKCYPCDGTGERFDIDPGAAVPCKTCNGTGAGQ